MIGVLRNLCQALIETYMFDGLQHTPTAGVTIMIMNELLQTVLLAIWLFLPAGVANAAPIFAAKLPFIAKFDAPLDLGLHVRGERALGSHKTWRGLVVGILAGILVFWLQQMAVQRSTFLTSLVNVQWTFTLLPTWLLGGLLGFGALGGDAVESFLKRRKHIPAGESWFPYDQIDYIIGAAAVSALAIIPPLAVYAAALFIWASIHLISTNIGYWLGVKERPI